MTRKRPKQTAIFNTLESDYASSDSDESGNADFEFDSSCDIVSAAMMNQVWKREPTSFHSHCHAIFHISGGGKHGFTIGRGNVNSVKSSCQTQQYFVHHGQRCLLMCD